MLQALLHDLLAAPGGQLRRGAQGQTGSHVAQRLGRPAKQRSLGLSGGTPLAVAAREALLGLLHGGILYNIHLYVSIGGPLVSWPLSLNHVLCS